MSARRWVLALLAGTALGAQAEIVELQWDAHSRFARELTVSPGKFVELCGRLPAQAAVEWRYEAAAPLDFNVHYHEGKDVHYPARASGSRNGSGTLQAASAQDYCWMWVNKGGADARVSVQLQRR